MTDACKVAASILAQLAEVPEVDRPRIWAQVGAFVDDKVARPIVRAHVGTPIDEPIPFVPAKLIRKVEPAASPKVQRPLSAHLPLILRIIFDHPGIKHAQLSKDLGVSASTLHGWMRRLEIKEGKIWRGTDGGYRLTGVACESSPSSSEPAEKSVASETGMTP